MTTLQVLPTPSVISATTHLVHSRVELELDLVLDDLQLAGEACAVCGRSVEGPYDCAERMGDVAVVDDGALCGVRVLPLLAHLTCKNQLEVRVSKSGELWPW